MSIPRNLSKIADNIDSNGVLTASGGGLPSQASQSGKYLTTDGTNSSWATVDSISEIDGGFANSVYTAPQVINGGTA
jgi:hypothetical protein